MSEFILTTDYRGCRIELLIGSELSAQLKINGIVRESQLQTLEKGANSGTLRLSSTIQTGYEWHEFVEGLVRYSEEAIEAKIFANSAELIARTYSRTGSRPDSQALSHK